MPPFVPGRELARAFYEEAVAPLLGDTPHSAALLGWGSEVLGFDTSRSTDHGWGPRLQVFVRREETARVMHVIDEGLPDEFHGWPTRFGWDEVPVSHHVEVGPLGDWLKARLGFDLRGGITTRDWLATPQQILLEVTRGAVFHDGLGDLTTARETLAWYPDEVWLWLMACQWRRIDQEEPFVGRTAEVGDELGSRVVAARLVRDVMRLCFFQERRYAPYSKWLGCAFRELDAFGALGDLLLDVLAATDYEAREMRLVEVVRILAGRHNALGTTAQVDESVRLFHDRPFRVLGSGRFVDACLERVSDPWLRSLPLTGAVDQFIDSTDVLSESGVLLVTASVFDAWTAEAKAD
ncbi:MAG: hypothetical protein A2Y55_10590 [Actinobacteria bacterium RBG_16_68_12]|nr:MAG: hypothetical protein A2Y55_10590 [Actinobacteria bacterium RBG_16_68_12]